jgi:hypothetical protein
VPRLACPSPAWRLRCTQGLPSPAPYACAQALSLNSALEERGILPTLQQPQSGATEDGAAEGAAAGASAGAASAAPPPAPAAGEAGTGAAAATPEGGRGPKEGKSKKKKKKKR